MSTPKLISPLLDNYMMGDPISDIGGVRCCPAMHQQTQEKYLVKIISVPASQTKLEALLLTGAYPDAEAAGEYFKQQAADLADEAQILKELSHSNGFEGFEGCQIVPMDDATGYDVYLLYPYRKTLERHCQTEAITHLEASNMALDICAALAACRNQGYIFMNLKPENIFLSAEKNYRIGDLGLLRLDSLKYASIPERYFSAYTAPELADAFCEPNETVDTYALGMILYEIYNGSLPVDGEQIPAPKYADEELSQIILKACASVPADRWQTPAQMGQALVSYIQRNGISDAPIVVLPPEPEIIEESVADEAIAEDAVEITEVEVAEAEESCEPVDETAGEDEAPAEVAAPEETTDEVTEEVIEEEPVAEAEESEAAEEYVEINEEIPEAVEDDTLQEFVDAIEEAISVEVTEDEAPAEAETAEEADESEDFENMSFMDEEPQEEKTDNEDIDDLLSQVEALISDEDEEEANDEEIEEAEDEPVPVILPDFDEEDEEKAPTPAKKRSKKWIGWLLAAVLLIGLLVGGYFFYTMYYLQPINDLSVVSTKDTVTIHVSSPLDSSELSVVLTNTYSEKINIPLIGGSATISGLQPNMTYTVTVEAISFHKLTGETTATFSTQKQTEILNLNVVTGNADGTAELTFQVNGPDSESWTATFTSENDMFVSLPFSGHSVTFTGLTVGDVYDVSVAPNDDLFITGTAATSYTASKVIAAKDLVITEFADSKLKATWSVPEGVTVDSWTVICSNDSGFSKTLNVTSPEATFEGIDTESDYTVQVTATNQSVSAQTSISTGAPTVVNLSASANASSIQVSWTSPDAAWKLRYELVGTDLVYEIDCSGTSATIRAVVPGQTYKITLFTGDGVQAAHPITTVTVPEAIDFTGYTVSRVNMQFSMCKTPAKADWTRADLQASDYTTTFAAGQMASFLIRLNKTYNTSPDTITSLFVIRDSEGKVVHTSSSASSWTNMWYKGYCELDIPSLPQAAGNYSITVYFNGGFAYNGTFTIG